MADASHAIHLPAMCRMFGLVATRATALSPWLAEGEASLRTLSMEHADGWGVASHDGDKGWSVEKHPACAARCAHFASVARDGRGGFPHRSRARRGSRPLRPLRRWPRARGCPSRAAPARHRTRARPWAHRDVPASPAGRIPYRGGARRTCKASRPADRSRSPERLRVRAAPEKITDEVGQLHWEVDT